MWARVEGGECMDGVERCVGEGGGEGVCEGGGRVVYGWGGEECG